MYNNLYDNKFVETGSRISGHFAIKPENIKPNINKTYGEILPDGIKKMMLEIEKHIPHKNIVFADLGMGCGKICIQVFNEYPNIQQVIGCEFYESRFNIAADALIKFAKTIQNSKQIGPHEYEFENSRFITYYNKNIFDLSNNELKSVDVILLHICEPNEAFGNKITQLLSKLEKKTLLISYEALSSPLIKFLNVISCDVSWKYREPHVRDGNYNPYNPNYDFYLYQMV